MFMTADFPQQPQSGSVPRADVCLPADLHQSVHEAARAVRSVSGAARIRYTKPQPRLTPLAQLLDRHVNYTAIVPLTEIPRAWHAGIRAYARLHQGRCYDSSGAGHYMLPDWHMLLSDPTPETVVVALRKCGAEEGYPYLAWRNAGLAHLPDYLDVLQALRFIACVLPEGTLGRCRLALFMRTVSH